MTDEYKDAGIPALPPVVEIKSLRHTQKNVKLMRGQKLRITGLYGEKSGSGKAVDIEYMDRNLKVRRMTIHPNPDNPLKELSMQGVDTLGEVVFKEHIEAVDIGTTFVEMVVKVLYCKACGHVYGVAQVPGDVHGQLLLQAEEEKGIRAGSSLTACVDCGGDLSYEMHAIKTQAPNKMPQKWEDFEKLIV